MRRFLSLVLIAGLLLSSAGCFWLVVDDDGVHDRGGRGGHGGGGRGGDGGGRGGGAGRH